MGVCCGIDLGTTYSAIAWYDAEHQRVEAIGLDHADGQQVIASTVYFAPGGGRVVGEAASIASLQYPHRVITSIKRRLGEAFQTVPIDDRVYTAQEVTAEILAVLKADAELYIGETVSDAVIAVPTYFDKQQYLALKEAGQLAGINISDLILEPYAAVLASMSDRGSKPVDRHVLVCDMGGGTLDVTLVFAERVVQDAGLSRLLDVPLYVLSDHNLGGLAWDLALARLVADKAVTQCGIPDPCADTKYLTALLRNCESAKRLLGRVSSLVVPVDLEGHSVEVTRGEFEQVAAPFLLQIETQITVALREAEKCHGLLSEMRIQELQQDGTPRSELEDKKVRLLLCGGAARMPMIRERIVRIMGEPSLQYGNPEMLVAVGAAHRAHLLGREARVIPGAKAPVIFGPTATQTVRDKPTPAHVIDMFRSVGLSVTDDADQIAASSLSERKLKWR